VSADDEYRRMVDELRGEDAGVTEAPMMGMPSPKAGGKLFAGFRDGALVVKVGRERAGALIDGGRAQPFDPSGRDRSMKDWAVLPLPGDDWSELAPEARRATG
jgi:hypothetical protein